MKTGAGRQHGPRNRRTQTAHLPAYLVQRSSLDGGHEHRGPPATSRPERAAAPGFPGASCAS
jgi:hypothetical protein